MMSKEQIVKAFAAVSLPLLILASDARAQAPAPSTAGTYPPVEVTPPKRELPPMTADEQSKLKNDLTTARDRQAIGGRTKRSVERPGDKKP